MSVSRMTTNVSEKPEADLNGASLKAPWGPDLDDIVILCGHFNLAEW